MLSKATANNVVMCVPVLMVVGLTIVQWRIKCPPLNEKVGV